MARSKADGVVERIPKRITKEFLLTAITHNDDTKDISIKDFTVSHGCKKGENFASNVLSVVVNILMAGKEMTKKLILKIPQSNDVSKEDDFQRRLYLKESSVFCDIIPAMIEFQVERGLHPCGPSVPLHLYSVVDKAGGVVVLEDLRPAGYKMTNLLSYDHCKLVLKELATYHALSFALKNGNPCNMEKFESALVENMWRHPFPEIFTRAFKLSLELVKTSTSDKHIIAAADKLGRKNLEDLMTKQLQPIEPYAVICHGDCWHNNMLFKYELIDDEEIPVDVKLIDFQICRYALPTIDLSFLLYTSTTREMRQNKLKDILSFYYDNFMQCLGFLNIDFTEYTLDILEKLYKQSVLYAIIYTFTITPLIIMDSGKLSEREKHGMKLSSFRQKFGKTAEYFGKRFAENIGEMVEMGVL